MRGFMGNSLEEKQPDTWDLQVQLCPFRRNPSLQPTSHSELIWPDSCQVHLLIPGPQLGTGMTLPLKVCSSFKMLLGLSLG